MLSEVSAEAQIKGILVEATRIIPDPNDDKKNTTETRTSRNANTAVVKVSGLVSNNIYQSELSTPEAIWVR